MLPGGGESADPNARKVANSDCGGDRPLNDVSAVAAGVAVYDSNNASWITPGGTSVATPIVAGIIVMNGIAPGMGPDAANLFYNAVGSGHIHKIKSGENYAGCPQPDLCSTDPAGAGAARPASERRTAFPTRSRFARSDCICPR